MSTALEQTIGVLLDRTIALECQLIAAGWCDSVSLAEAAERHSLCRDSFADPVVGFLFAYIVTCANRGIQPDTEHCIRVARHEHIDIDDERELLSLLLDTDYRADELDNCVFAVVLLGDRRAKAQDLLRQAERLIDDGMRGIVIVKSREAPQRTFVPGRLKKKWRSRCVV